MRELNENLVYRLLSLEAREKARAEKKDKAENMNTAKGSDPEV